MGMTKPIHKAGETRAGFAVVMMIGHDGGFTLRSDNMPQKLPILRKKGPIPVDRSRSPWGQRLVSILQEFGCFLPVLPGFVCSSDTNQ